MMQIDTVLHAPADFPAPSVVGSSFVRITVKHVVIEANIGCAADMVQLGGLVDRTIDRFKRQRNQGPASRYVQLLPPGEARLLSVEIEDFLDNHKKAGLSLSTLEKYGAALHMLLVTTGDVLVSHINKEHIRAYWDDTFRWWPRGAGSKNKFKGLTNLEVLAAGRIEAAKPRSFKYYQLNDSILEMFFGRLTEQNVYNCSPMRGIAKRKRKGGVMVGRDLNDAELQSIFNPETYIPWARKYPHRWWAPMIALYTGARISEVCHLKVSDIIEQYGVWCFSLQGVTEEDVGDDESLSKAPKTEASHRIIPIAQPLLEAGFLEFVKDVSDAKRVRLFPQLKAKVDLKTGELYGSGYAPQHINQFGEYLRANTNLKKGVGSHAFRHTLSTRLQAKPAKVDVELIATITGHTPDLRVPTLQTHYIHCDPAELRELQAAALAKFNPPVSLPMYTPGQFLNCLRPGAKCYP